MGALGEKPEDSTSSSGCHLEIMNVPEFVPVHGVDMCMCRGSTVIRVHHLGTTNNPKVIVQSGAKWCGARQTLHHHPLCLPHSPLVTFGL